VESAREGATGYSFPSGHTQCATGLYGGVARSSKRRAVQITGVALCFVIAFTRMYLGVHTPQDVLVSMVVAFVLIAGFYLLLRLNDKYPYVIYIVIGALFLLIVAFMVFLYTYPFPEDVFLKENIGNYESALKNAYTMLGCVLGVLVFRIVDDKITHYDTKAVWWAQILKLVIGLGIVLLVKEGTKPILDAIFGGHLAARAVRYFLVVLAATGWTFTFKFWQRLGKKKAAESTATTEKNE
jgi:undecaprenyl-diphosphatase